MGVHERRQEGQDGLRGLLLAPLRDRHGHELGPQHEGVLAVVRDEHDPHAQGEDLAREVHGDQEHGGDEELPALPVQEGDDRGGAHEGVRHREHEVHGARRVHGFGCMSGGVFPLL